MKIIKSLIFIILLYPIQLWAADFNQGNIYYNITGENTVEVTNNSPAMGVYSGNIEIPETVTYNEITYNVTGIGESAFMFSSFLASVIIPSSVEYIESNAFFLCGSLTSVVIPEGVKSIKNEAFSRCVMLTSISISQSVENIGNSAFANCASLLEIILGWENPSTVNYGTDIFDAVDIENCTLKVPLQSQPLYDQTSPWSVFENIVESHSDFVVDNLGTLIEYVGAGGNIIIPYGVKSIGNNIFENNMTIQSVIIPSSVTSIGNGAFLGCGELISVTISNSVTFIDNAAFAFCASLQEINVLWSNPNAIADEGIMIYGSGLFSFTPQSCIVNVPDGLLPQYNIYPWFYFDNIRCQAIPTIQELENQGLVQEVSELEYAVSGIYGDDKSFTTYLQLDSWYCTYVCKYALNEGDILDITDNEEGFNSTIKIYDEQGNEQTIETIAANTKIAGFKAGIAGIYYVQFSGMPNFENAAYDFSIRKYGELQSFIWGEIPTITDNMSETEIKSLLSDLSITGQDLYEQDITHDSSSDFWTINTTDGTATFSPSHEIFGNIKFSLASNINNIITLWNGEPTNIAQVNFSGVEIYIQNRTIIIENANEPASIYNMLGVLVEHDTKTEFTVPHAGIYMVKIGKTVKKVVVK